MRFASRKDISTVSAFPGRHVPRQKTGSQGQRKALGSLGATVAGGQWDYASGAFGAGTGTGTPGVGSARGNGKGAGAAEDRDLVAH